VIESILIILEGKKAKKYRGRSMTSTQAGRSRVQARVREENLRRYSLSVFNK